VFPSLPDPAVGSTSRAVGTKTLVGVGVGVPGVAVGVGVNVGGTGVWVGVFVGV
jgi:hypothetical protein